MKPVLQPHVRIRSAWEFKNPFFGFRVAIGGKTGFPETQNQQECYPVSWNVWRVGAQSAYLHAFIRYDSAANSIFDDGSQTFKFIFLDFMFPSFFFCES